MADLTSLSDEELEQEGFRRQEAAAAAQAEFRPPMMEVQAEISRRSAERGGAAPQPTEAPAVPVEE